MSWGHKGRHSDQTTAKLRIRSEIYLQPHKSPLMSHKCSPQRHLFFSPEYFQNDSPASLESTVLSRFGESLSVNDIPLHLSIFRSWLKGQKHWIGEHGAGRSGFLVSSPAVSGHQRKWQGEEAQAKLCTCPLSSSSSHALLQFTSLTISLDFSITSFQICFHISVLLTEPL